MTLSGETDSRVGDRQLEHIGRNVRISLTLSAGEGLTSILAFDTFDARAPDASALWAVWDQLRECARLETRRLDDAKE